MILKGRYCILEKIGAGGEGSLYLARDMELGVYRAVKEIPLSGKREAKLLRLLSHPAMPAMLDYAEKTEFCYLVMEYISGCSLGALLRKGKSFTAEEILSFGITAADVLQYLHTRKPPVYYGDLKPDNLMLSENGRLYLVDYGSAVFGYERRFREVRGTKGYAAPEQYEGFVGEKSDIYALGRTLWELSKNGRLQKILCCPGLFRVIMRCCQKEERFRYQSGKQVKDKLARILLQKKRFGFRPGLRAGAAVFLISLGSLLMLRPSEKEDFWKSLTKITDGYYEETFQTDGEARKEICKTAERSLKKLLSQYPEGMEQQRLLLLLAVNAELADAPERAEVYYEQLLLYQEDCREVYEAYNAFLKRYGQTEKIRRLQERYENKKEKEEAFEKDREKAKGGK